MWKQTLILGAALLCLQPSAQAQPFGYFPMYSPYGYPSLYRGNYGYGYGPRVGGSAIVRSPLVIGRTSAPLLSSDLLFSGGGQSALIERLIKENLKAPERQNQETAPDVMVMDGKNIRVTSVEKGNVSKAVLDLNLKEALAWVRESAPTAKEQASALVTAIQKELRTLEDKDRKSIVAGLVKIGNEMKLAIIDGSMAKSKQEAVKIANNLVNSAGFPPEFNDKIFDKLASYISVQVFKGADDENKLRLTELAAALSSLQ